MNAPDDETLSTAEPAKAQPPHTAAPPAATEVPVSTYQPGLPKKERKPLNPALAILAGASLTAISGITATVLNIRSSERLSKERDKTDVAVQQRNDLEVKIGAIQTQLDKAKELLTTAGSTVAAAVVPTPVPAPPAIDRGGVSHQPTGRCGHSPGGRLDHGQSHQHFAGGHVVGSHHLSTGRYVHQSHVHHEYQ